MIYQSKDIIGSFTRPFFERNGGVKAFKANEIMALNDLVDSLFGVDLWRKMLAIYPFVGRTSAAHSFNIKNLNQYQITWNGSVIHNSNGINGNGGWGNTNFPIVFFKDKLNDIHLSAYNRTDIQSATNDGRLIGVNTVNLNQYYSDRCAHELNFSITNGGIIGYVYSEYNALGGYGYTQNQIDNNIRGRGFMIGTNCSKCYLNGEIFGSWQPLLPTQIHFSNTKNIILLGNRSDTNVSSAARVNLCFASIGYGLNEKEVEILTKIIETFQKALFRSVL